MPIDERIVACPSQIPVFKCNSDVILQASGVSQTVVLISQFASLSALANDIFTTLFHDTSTILNRLITVSDVIARVGTTMASMDNQTLATLKAVKASDHEMGGSNFTFMNDSLPAPLRERFQKANPMPDFSSLDQFDDLKNCASKYSHPEFFIEQWLINERQRQKDAEQARLKKREERRARRKIDRMKNATASDEKGVRIAVNAVKKKQYHVHGQEFAGIEVEGPAATSTSIIPVLRRFSLDGASTHRRSSVECGPTVAVDPSLIQLNQEVELSVCNSASPQNEPTSFLSESVCSSSNLPSPPPPPLFLSPPIVPVIRASECSDVVLPAVPPPPPPLSSFAYEPEEYSEPPPVDRSALLSGIQQGMTLKRAALENMPVKPENDREDLLSQIRQGGALRSTPKVPSSPAKTDDAYSEIKALLNRRQFLAPIDSDHSEGDGSYDSDDWKE